MVRGVARHEFQEAAALAVLGDIKRALLGAHQRSKFRQQELRDGKQVSASPTPVPAPPTFESLSDLINTKTDLIPPLGIFVIDLNTQLIDAMATRAQSGVIVAGLLSGEPATLSDLTVGDVITTINGKPVKDKQELLQDLNGFKTGDPIALQVERRGVTQYVAFEME